MGADHRDSDQAYSQVSTRMRYKDNPGKRSEAAKPPTFSPFPTRIAKDTDGMKKGCKASNFSPSCKITMTEKQNWPDIAP
mmetsp:Transcript_16788/g.24854  ORF Transcript_16788/g.24854 Transcript_16788/m.24854 type:complete len:80 (-) Transcript_16788:310-549(-)